MSSPQSPGDHWRGARSAWDPHDPSDTLDTAINSKDALIATARNAANLHAGLDADHIINAMCRAGVPGEPVTAGLVYRTAAALAGQVAAAPLVAPPAPPRRQRWHRGVVPSVRRAA